MNKLFIADKDFSREIPRTRAKGYKRVVVSEELEMAMPFQFQTDGTDLVVVPAEAVEGEGECYTVLCREFGLVGGNQGFKSKMSVIFCDNGWMLVTLYHGGLVMNLDGRLLMPTVGDDIVTPKVVRDHIMWVDAEKILAYSKYLGQKGYFMYDHEFMLELSGDNVKGMGSFIFKCFDEETIDMSLGYIAQYEQTKIKRAEAREAQNTFKMLQSSWAQAQATPMEFEEPDPSEVGAREEEEDDDSGVDW